MMPKVSILVPVYNVSKYIERCAHSLFQQTFEDIEYVFVNDGTQDDSIEKLQKVIELYPDRKIKIIHHEKNRGLAAARNTAIDNSTGKYIQHIDSDDWIEADMIETMYNKAETEQADIVVCDFIFEGITQKEYRTDEVVNSKEENFRNMLIGKVCQESLCNKLINRKLFSFKDCVSIEGLNYMEDRHLTIRLYFYADKIVKIDRAFYHYDKTNEKSITSNKVKIHFENLILFWDLLDIFLKEKNIYDKYSDIIEQSKVENKVGLITQTHSCRLRKQYAWLFRDIEMKYFNRFRLGEKLILFFTHYRMYLLADVVHKLLIFKNKKT